MNISESHRPSSRATFPNRQAYIFVFLIVMVVTWKFSEWTFRVYQFGDLFHYRRFWEIAATRPFDELFRLQRSTIGAGEPLYALTVYFLTIFGHDSVNITANMILIGALIALCWKFQVPLLILPLILTNYYLIVVLSSAERLKFALIPLELALLTSGYVRIVFQAMAPFFHLQGILFLFPQLFDALSSRGGASGNSFKFRKSVIVLGCVLLCALIFYVAGDALLGKATAYHAIEKDFPWQAMAVAAVGTVCFRHRKPWAWVLALLAAVAIVLGGTRLNMVSVVVLLCMFAVERRYWHPVFLAVSIYLTAKGVIFVQTYGAFGTGWPRAGEYLELSIYS